MSDEYQDSQDDFTSIDSPNATYFRSSEAPESKQNKYRNLWRYNEGLWKTRRRVDNQEAWRRHRLGLLRSLTSRLELTDWQRKQAESVIERIDLGEISDGQQSSLNAICFSICAFIANQEAEPHRSDSNIYLPSKSDLNNPDRFVDMQDELGLSDSEVQKAMDELRQEFEVFNDG